MRHEAALLALSPFFWKGIAVTICAFILFVGSIYVLLSAVFGRRLGYLVMSVAFFAWMILFSALWTFGAPGTPRNLGPRGMAFHSVRSSRFNCISTTRPSHPAFPRMK